MTATSIFTPPAPPGLTDVVPIRTDADIVEARRRMRELTTPLGFMPGDVAMMATAVSELARNIINYAGEGEIALEVVERDRRVGMVVVARDRGPGIADVEQAMQDGFSSGQGLGLGLPGSRRLMDDLELVSAAGVGTTVTARKWVPAR